MLPNVLLSLLLAGTFDVTGQLGANAPFGALEFNQRGGITGGIALGYNSGRSRFELLNEFSQLPGSQQAAYSLLNYRLGASYHHALTMKTDWLVRAGLGLDWNNLRRSLGGKAETGSVIGGTVAFTYLRRFGHPQFSFQLFGSELLEFGRAGGNRTVVPATLVGVKIGAGYEL
jgi:hypothetical protein